MHWYFNCIMIKSNLTIILGGPTFNGSVLAVNSPGNTIACVSGVTPNSAIILGNSTLDGTELAVNPIIKGIINPSTAGINPTGNFTNRITVPTIFTVIPTYTSPIPTTVTINFVLPHLLTPAYA